MMPDWIAVIIRTFAAIIVLFALTKFLGKRQVSQLSLFEYITGITIGSLAGDISLDLEGSWFLGIIAILTWGAIAIGIEHLQLRSKRVREFIDGKSTILVEDGKLLEENLKKERLTADEFMQQLRKRDIFQLADVEFALMEPSGEINVLVKKESLPITAKMLGVQVAEEKEPQTVIMDGEILNESLGKSGRNRGWLHSELGRLGVSAENVFIGQVDSNGQLTVDLYNDQIQIPEEQQKANLLATLKKCEENLELLGLCTLDSKRKQIYQNVSQPLQEAISNLRTYLIR